ncbi:MAG TPA: FeoA family protein [Pyrinomonadaceae bacterium]|jgi:Fe2+ transport system protein FeoA
MKRKAGREAFFYRKASAPLLTGDTGKKKTMTLDKLERGRSATIVQIFSENAERRRLFDLGILPGTRIESVMASPLGDPVAYRVRNSVVALRREQANLIEVEEERHEGFYR